MTTGNSVVYAATTNANIRRELLPIAFAIIFFMHQNEMGIQQSAFYILVAAE